MTPPLVNHLRYDVMTYYGNDILLRQAEDTPHIENHTKIYFQELSTLTLQLPDQSQPITL